MRRGVRPHRGRARRGNFDPDPGVSAGTVFGVQCPPDGQRGAVSAGPDVATGVTSPVNYPSWWTPLQRSAFVRRRTRYAGMILINYR